MLRYTEESTEAAPLPPGGRIEVETFNGSIEITGQERDTVEVRSTKHASSEELLSRIQVEVTHGPGWVRIRGHKPAGLRGEMGVSFVIAVPRHVSLEHVQSSNGSLHATEIAGPANLRTSNGSVHVSRLDGALQATTSDGSIHLDDIRGTTSVRTSNGAIKAMAIRGAFEATNSNGAIAVEVLETGQGRATVVQTSNSGLEIVLHSLDGDVHASTTNGNVVLRIPASAGARLAAKTSNGSVQSEFDLTSGTRSKNRIDGTLGAGGPLLDLRSSNGPIQVLKR